MLKPCTHCSILFKPKGDWQKLCWNCWWEAKQEKEAQPETHSTISWDLAFVRKLIQLCHPDKHNGSNASTNVTQELLRIKQQLERNK